MSQISRQRRFKRAALLTKRTQCLGRYPRNRGCMASYEHLRSNNSCLAKALSKQKEKKQLLFSQNVALLAEVQDLSSACIKRDNTIIKVLQNAKEMLKMLVTLTKFVTNTITSCQEFTSSTNTNARLSCNPFSKGENRRLSVKQPTKGIVKPMVSGHTITKPTINLSRVNMQHYNNSNNLSTIEEVSTPVAMSPPNSNANEDTTPTSVSLRGQPRNADGRICRMPERLTITSPRTSDGDERRLSKQKSRHSGKLPERRSRSKSNRLSESMNRGERPDLMTSVRVTLDDVSNWLQNSPTINIRRLSSTKYNVADDNIEVNDSTSNISNRRNKDVIIISKRQLSTNFSEENSNNTIESNSTGIENEQPELNVQGNSRDSRNDVSNENDPLEGPSWLLDSYNSNSSLTNTRMESSSEVKDCNNKSDDTTKTSTTHRMQCNSSSDSDSDTDSDSNNDEEDNNESNNFNCKKTTFKSRSSEKGSVLSYFQEDDIKLEEHDNMNKEGFVTRQRGNSTEAMDDDLDDFTLMHMRRNVNNVSFSINDLRLPVLEDTVVESIVKTEVEPEMTTTLGNLPENSEIPLIFNNIYNDDSLIDRNTVKLPPLSNTAIDCTIPVVDISLDMHRQTKLRKSSQSLDLDHFESITSRKAAKRKEKKSLNDKDPSTAKVVLQKLPHNKDFHVKSRPFSLEETLSQNSSILSPKILHSPPLKNSSDSESSTGSINLSTSNDSSKRPKRQKAPQNLREPNLRKKLRRFK